MFSQACRSVNNGNRRRHDNTEKFLAKPREILERRRNSKLLPALTRGTRATAGASKYLHSRVAPPDCIDISNWFVPSALQLWQLQIRIVSDIWFEINTI